MTRKLVRDRIPEIIRRGGQEPILTVPIDDIDHLELLLAKLQEEASELEDAAWSGSATWSGGGFVAEEIVDLLEVLRALADFFDLDWQRVERAREDKRATHGGFAQRLVWLGNHDTGGAA